MRVASVLRQFADVALRRQAVREIAFEMPKRRLEQLAELRTGIAAIDGPNDFDRGYQAAIREVLEAYEAAVTPDADIDHALETALQTRAHWEPVVVELQQPCRPGDLAARLEVDPSVISRTLAKLGKAGVVEEVPGDKHDGRMRLYRLTLRGEEVVRRVLQSGPVPIAAMARVAARFFADLATRRRLTRAELAEQVRATARFRVGQVHEIVKALVEAAANLSLVFERGELLVASELTAQSRLAQELDLAVRDLDSSTIADLKSRIPDDCAVFVRCAKLKDSWNLVLTREFTEYPDARTIDPCDVMASAIPTPSGKFVLVYDNETLLKQDLADDAATRLHEQAEAKVYLSSGLPPELPRDWQRVSVPGVN